MSSTYPVLTDSPPGAESPVFDLPAEFSSLPGKIFRLPSQNSLSFWRLAPLITWKIDYDLNKENSVISSTINFSTEVLIHQLFWIWVISTIFVNIRMRLFPHRSLWGATWSEFVTVMWYGMIDSTVLVYANTIMVNGNTCEFWGVILGLCITLFYVYFMFIMPAGNPTYLQRTRLSFF
ncbi:hypothetical protein F4820DRAFT_435649 [Hypoxylon rubiginosum]|uniref:Uncharacterized protein n=1 Tax=Hypoxylon rubiginosum TaxID=110542 RepID=A0ACB9YNA4_9PEZI|nr:hypothetical protein F4820DRAFT_435649 [Hypoxylon rubiginosum]